MPMVSAHEDELMLSGKAASHSKLILGISNQRVTKTGGLKSRLGLSLELKQIYCSTREECMLRMLCHQ